MLVVRQTTISTGGIVLRSHDVHQLVDLPICPGSEPIRFPDGDGFS